MNSASFLEAVLFAVLLPVWLLAGFADALCHRVLRIETSAGWRESALHWLMLAELGVGLAAVLLLEVNALAIAIFAIACVLHEITMVVDLRYASARRVIPPVEQWVHGVQQAIPWMVLLVLCALQPGQALALIGVGGAAPDFSLRLAPVPAAYLASFIAAGVLVVALPFALELLRGLRAVRETRRA